MGIEFKCEYLFPGAEEVHVNEKKACKGLPRFGTGEGISTFCLGCWNYELNIPRIENIEPEKPVRKIA